MADGLKDARKLVKALRKKANELGLEIVKFDLNLVGPPGGETCEIMFAAKPEAIETNTEKAKRKEKEAFEQMMSGQEFSEEATENEETRRLREERLEKQRNSAPDMLRRLLDGDDD